LFLEANHSESSLIELADYAAWAIEQSTVSLYDKLYLAWTIWRMRTKITRTSKERIRILTQETLNNLMIFFQEPYIDQNTEDAYGLPRGYRPSKIALAVYFDLQRAFQKDTITVSKEEFEQVGVLARFSGMLGVLGLVLSIAIGHYASTSGMLKVGDLTISGGGVERVLANLLVVTPMFLLAASGGSLVYDGFIRPVTVDQIIIANLNARLRKYLTSFVAVILGSLVVLLIVGR